MEADKPELLKLALNACVAYSEVPTTEVWTEETIESTVKQIKFFWESGLFEKRSDVIRVIDDLESLIRNLHKQCDLGLKIKPGGSVSDTPFTCYASDLMIGNNCVQVKTNSVNAGFIGYNTFNFMSTTNLEFTCNNDFWMKNLISKSTQISRTAEKTRNQFMKVLANKVDDLSKFVEEN